MRTPLLTLFLGPLLFTLAFLVGGADALGQDGAGPANPEWTLGEVLGVLGVAATWLGIIAAGLSFAANMGRLSMTIEHLGGDIRSQGTKIDALGVKIDRDVQALEEQFNKEVKGLESKIDNEVKALTAKHDTLATQVTRLDALSGVSGGAARTKTNVG